MGLVTGIIYAAGSPDTPKFFAPKNGLFFARAPLQKVFSGGAALRSVVVERRYAPRGRAAKIFEN